MVFALEMKKLEPRKAKGRAQGHMATSRHVGDRSPEVLPPGTPPQGSVESRREPPSEQTARPTLGKRTGLAHSKTSAERSGTLLTLRLKLRQGRGTSWKFSPLLAVSEKALFSDAGFN